jgi:hypothetical protein
VYPSPSKATLGFSEYSNIQPKTLCGNVSFPVLCSTPTKSSSVVFQKNMFEYLLAAVGAYVGWCLVCLELNYRKASSMGIPVIRLPIDFLNMPFQVIEPHIFKLIDLLPASVKRSLPTFVPYLRRGWFFLDKAESHLRYGSVFAFVTPRSIWVQVCDSEAIHDIFSRRLDFLRPQENYSMI